MIIERDVTVKREVVRLTVAGDAHFNIVNGDEGDYDTPVIRLEIADIPALVKGLQDFYQEYGQ